MRGFHPLELAGLGAVVLYLICWGLHCLLMGHGGAP